MTLHFRNEVRRLAGRRLSRPACLVVLGLAIAWALSAANLTLFVAPGDGPRNGMPFRTIGDYLTDTSLPVQVRVRNLLGNMVLVAPLGMSLAALTRWRTIRLAVFLLLISCSIEVWQLVGATGRSVDIDDVILNVVGGLAGWLLGLGLLKFAERVVPAALARDGNGPAAVSAVAEVGVGLSRR